jgi:putative hydrolase of the HAD superfamily
MIKLVIFDLGETLIFYKGLALNWSEHYNHALEIVFNNLSLKYDPDKTSRASSILLKYNTRINPRTEEITSYKIFSEILSTLNLDTNLIDSFIKEFFKYFQRTTEPEKTAIELLSALKEKNIFTAVLTDVPYGMPKELILEDLKPVSNYIDFVLTSVEVGTRKPSTAGIEIILNKFNCTSSEAILIGNEKKDIETAISAGLIPVLLSKDESTKNWGQAKTIFRLVELIQYFNITQLH